MYCKKTRKLEAKFIKALVGYDEQTKAYMLFNLVIKMVQLSRDLHFNKEKFGFSKSEEKGLELVQLKQNNQPNLKIGTSFEKCWR
jgi:hypothetical protein